MCNSLKYNTDFLLKERFAHVRGTLKVPRTLRSHPILSKKYYLLME